MAYPQLDSNLMRLTAAIRAIVGVLEKEGQDPITRYRLYEGVYEYLPLSLERFVGLLTILDALHVIRLGAFNVFPYAAAMPGAHGSRN